MAQVLENLGFSKLAALLDQMLCPESGESAATLLRGSDTFRPFEVKNWGLGGAVAVNSQKGFLK
jgi:hypothetical protein